jgi:hypothetical protein
MPKFAFTQTARIERTFVIEADSVEDAWLLFENGNHEETNQGPYLSYGLTEFAGPGTWGAEVLTRDWSKPKITSVPDYVDSGHDFYNPAEAKQNYENRDERLKARDAEREQESRGFAKQRLAQLKGETTPPAAV